MQRPGTQGQGQQMFRACISAGRLLILLIAALLLVMPWTEYFWNFDRFLRGGQDFELGLLAVMIFLSLLVVLLQRGQADVLFLFTRLRRLPWIAHCAVAIQGCCHRNSAVKLFAVPLAVSHMDLYNLPIQV